MTTQLELWDSAEIAGYLRVSRKTVQNNIVHSPGFPRPVAGARRNRLWVKDEVMQWILKTRRAA